MVVFKKISRFFGKLEDSVRFHLSRHPVLYSLITAFFIVLFWKGVENLISRFAVLSNGIILIVVSVPVLLITGVFISFFVTDRVLLSGIKHEERLEKKPRRNCARRIMS